MNRQTADGRYYGNTTTLDSITAPAGNVSLNTYKITGLGDATTATDALNRQTADSRYVFQTTPLSSITVPDASLDMNTHKIINAVDPTSNQDVATKIYVDTKVADLVDSAPGVLDTLNELATAL